MGVGGDVRCGGWAGGGVGGQAWTLGTNFRRATEHSTKRSFGTSADHAKRTFQHLPSTEKIFAISHASNELGTPTLDHGIGGVTLGVWLHVAARHGMGPFRMFALFTGFAGWLLTPGQFHRGLQPAETRTAAAGKVTRKWFPITDWGATTKRAFWPYLADDLNCPPAVLDFALPQHRCRKLLPASRPAE